MNRTTLRVLGVLAFAFLVGLLAAGCQDDGPSLTGASSVTESASQLATTSPSHSNSGESSGEDGEDGDDDSEDDTSDDDSDDASEDDESDDDADDDSDDESADDDGDSEVRGLLFATTTCPVPVADCIQLQIKDTLVAVTDETEIVNEPAGETQLSVAELAALASDHPGLPMRAEGFWDGGLLVAQRLRIDDEIRATGQVIELPGCGLGLAVELLQLCFDLSPGLAAPAPPSTVRVEGSVPIGLTPFLATEIESSND